MRPSGLGINCNCRRNDQLNLVTRHSFIGELLGFSSRKPAITELLNGQAVKVQDLFDHRHLKFRIEPPERAGTRTSCKASPDDHYAGCPLRDRRCLPESGRCPNRNRGLQELPAAGGLPVHPPRLSYCCAAYQAAIASTSASE